MATQRERTTPKRPVFISHAHKDSRLAARFVDLLVNGIGVSRRKCFASSLPLCKIPNGYDEHGYLKECLTSSTVRIALVTPNFLQSENCNAELGYMWATRENPDIEFIPLTFKVSPRTDDRPWYLRDTKLAILNDDSNLTELRTTIRQRLHIRSTPARVWRTELDSFTAAVEHMVSDVPESIDYESMGEFMDACEKYSRAIFFNVQVSFDDWFRPELQTHLALQDATTTRWQLDKVINVNDDVYATRRVPLTDLPDYYGTPTARILFLAYERSQLIDKLKHRDREVQNFVDLALIHLFMATPLAVVTVDQLDEILRTSPDADHADDLDFTNKSKNARYASVLNLPSARKLDANKRTRLRLIRGKLDAMIMRAEEDPTSGIDFALLMNKRDSDGWQDHQVWIGGVSEDTKDMQYLPVTDETKRDTLYRFAKRIEHTVFRPLTEDEVQKHPDLSYLLYKNALGANQKHKYARRLLAHRSPCFKVFHQVGKDPRLRHQFARTMKLVLPAYCPLHILSAIGAWREVFHLFQE